MHRSQKTLEVQEFFDIVGTLESYPARYTDHNRRDHEHDTIYHWTKQVGTESSEYESCDDISRIVHSTHHTSRESNESE